MAGIGEGMIKEDEDLVAIGEKIIIKVDKEEDKTKAGLYIPEQAKRQSITGVVYKIGSSVELEKYPLKEGDKVIFSRYAGLDALLEDELFKICMPDDIVAIMVKKEKIDMFAKE